MKTDVFWNGIFSLFFIVFAILIGCKEEEMLSTPPVAVFTVEPQAGVISTIFNFDASGSHDNEDAQYDLKVRWDWENDGIWETPFSTIKTETHQYDQEGTYSVKLEVIDKNEDSGSDTAKVFVTNGEEGEPCPETPTIEYEGKVYNTVLIGDQCWMKENLNAGVRKDGNMFQEDNGILEKFCYDELESNCDTFGGLYMYGEMMNYTHQEGTRGICPEGWHVASHEDWCILTHYINNTIDCNTILTWIGSDVGIKMKAQSGWKYNVNGSNVSGFSALPGVHIIMIIMVIITI
jgi:uncharacterized protein (TIGR02145 family)